MTSKKEERIHNFLDSEREDYLDFIFTLEERVPSHIQAERAKKRFQMERPDPDKEGLENGVYGAIVDEPPVQELDFTAFSLNAMKKLVEQDKMRDTIRILDEMKDTERVKNLRIQLFESLKYAASPYFNIDKYKEILIHMKQAVQKVHSELHTHDITPLSKQFDSVMFQAHPHTAQTIRDKLNSLFTHHELHLETYNSAVNFYNIAMLFQRGDGWRMTKQNGTDYDDVKEGVVLNLTKLEWAKAFEAISNNKHRNPSKFKEYAATLNQMRQETEREVKQSTFA